MVLRSLESQFINTPNCQGSAPKSPHSSVLPLIRRCFLFYDMGRTLRGRAPRLFTQGKPRTIPLCLRKVRAGTAIECGHSPLCSSHPPFIPAVPFPHALLILHSLALSFIHPLCPSFTKNWALNCMWQPRTMRDMSFPECTQANPDPRHICAVCKLDVICATLHMEAPVFGMIAACFAYWVAPCPHKTSNVKCLQRPSSASLSSLL